MKAYLCVLYKTTHQPAFLITLKIPTGKLKLNAYLNEGQNT